MSNDVRIFIIGTFTVLVIAWLVVNYQGADQVINAGANGYATAAHALLPTNAAGG